MTDATSRVPRLVAAAGGGGLPHAVWRPQMQTFLMQHGIEESDYAHEIPLWREIVAAVGDDAQTRRTAAIATVLGVAAGSKGGASASSSSPKTELLTDEQKAAKKEVSELIARSRKAYGFLYAALPTDLRQLIADVPQGYAYGVWSFLEKKFRNTEQDTVMVLWERYVSLRQETDETFDVYKARVDSVVELLTHAKQSPPGELYATLLLWRLLPHYATAVLTLKTSERLKDVAKIEWASIAQFMAEFERSQLALGEGDGAADRAMAARNATSAAAAQQSSSFSRGAPETRICFNCGKPGHIRWKCPQPRKPRADGEAWQTQKRKGGPREAHPSGQKKTQSASASDNDEPDEGHAQTPRTQQGARANVARDDNRFEALSDVEDEAPAPRHPGRSYCARVLAGIAREQAAHKPAHAPQPPHTQKQQKSLDVALKTTAKAVDTGASVSTTSNRSTLVNVRRCSPMPIKLADGTVLTATYKGDLPLRLRTAENSESSTYTVVNIKDVYFHERFDANLLSWGCMKEDGWELHSTPAGTYVKTPGPNGKRVNASTRGRLTILDDAGCEHAYGARMGRIVCTSVDDVVLLHRRMGHASWTQMKKTCKTGAAFGAGDLSGLTDAELTRAEEAVRACTSCAKAKAHRNPLGHHGLDKGTKLGEVVHMDTFYAVTRDAATGKKKTQYCLLATDAYTEWRWASMHDSRMDLPQAVIDILQHCRSMTDKRVRLVVADLGGEFDNRLLQKYCSDRGIELKPAPARAKELNGVAEKSVDTVKNHARAMQLAAGIPEQMGWAHAVRHHIYLWNRTHVGRRTGMAPLQAMTGREPSILNVGEFGCDAYVHLDRTQRDTTFSPKAEPAIYLGHSGRQNCPVVRLLRSGKVLLAKDVQFREGAFTHLVAQLSNRVGDFEPVDIIDALTRESDNPSAQQRDAVGSFDAASDGDVDASDSNESSAQPDSKFRLKAITDVQTVDGIKKYRVKWVGYAGETWEPAADIEQDAPDAVREYESFLSRRSQARATRSQARAQPAPVAAASAPSVASVDHDNESDVGAAAAYAAQRL